MKKVIRRLTSCIVNVRKSAPPSSSTGSTIAQAFWTLMDLRSPELSNKLLDLIVERTDEYRPHLWFGGPFTRGKNVPISADNRSRLVEALQSPRATYVVFTNQDKKQRDFVFGFTVTFCKGFSVLTLGVTSKHLGAKESLTSFVNIGVDIVTLIDPVYGSIHDTEDAARISGGRATDVVRRIPGVYWGNYFGDYYTEKIGRDKLLAFRQGRVTEIDKRGVMILTSDTPIRPDDAGARQGQKALAEIIRPFL